ncbi:MAG: immunoglobulin domain-containing protein [Bacteroidales bacterium]|nr:immunoglobulin domain-containing protein [Bacteroidales bacterium]
MKKILFIFILALFAGIFVNAQNWQEILNAQASDGATNDDFGYCVSISGDYAIVGAHSEDHDINGENYLLNAGSAYIFQYNGTSWQEIQKIVASDRGQEDNFGKAVSISGNYIVVGAFREDEDINGENTLTSAGSAYIFFNNEGVWEETQKITASDREAANYFGRNVSMCENYIIIGAYENTTDASGENSISKAGASYIFYNNAGTWEEMQKIVASDRAFEDRFGASVAISNNYAVVGAYYENEDENGNNTLNDAGSAYIFYNNAGTWQEVQKIVASDRAYQDYFSISVAIYGDYIMIGAWYEDEDESGGNTMENSGSAYVFYNNEGVWQETQKLTASDRNIQDVFGLSISISGNYAIINSYNDDEDANGENFLDCAGSAYIFYNNAGIWEETQKIVASDRAEGDLFGRTIAIDNNIIISGAYGKNNFTGKVYIFNANPNIVNQPSNQSINEGDNAVFSLIATGADSYQWQENTGSSFENIIDVDIYSGAETNTLTITGVSLYMTDYQYQCVVTNSNGNTISNTAILTVCLPVSISSHPESQTICEGNDTIFGITATNADSYKWQVNTGSNFEDITNGVVYSGAETDTLTITGAGFDMNNYQYHCIASNLCVDITSNSAFLMVSPTVYIISQPENQTICEGNDTIFSITATNVDNYQWQVNTGSSFEDITDDDIYSGAETNTLIITGVNLDMTNYQYQCIIDNLCGDITSNIAVLTINPLVSITSQPESQTICEGNDTIFGITATNVDSYQWQVNTGSGFEDITNGDIYSGIETDTLIITSVTANMNTYEYQCIIDNLCGDITSSIAILTVNPLVSITSQPENQTICEGNDTIFSITATNADGYKWQVNTGSGFEDITDDNTYSGAETDTLTITNATVNMNTYEYQCIVDNSCGDITSNIAVLTVNPLVSITSQPKNQTICEGNDTIFCITATNADNYKWQVNTGSNFEDITDDDIYSGAETDTLTITSVTANMNTYEYQCVADNSCGDITSNIAVLTVNPLVSITSQPKNQTICEGNDTIFCITATNADNYKWQVNTGSNFEDITDDDIYSGAETDTLTITSATANMNTYEYQCVADNSCGDITSNIAILTVNSLVSITSQPENQTICEGNDTIFGITATNADNYQWQVNTGSNFEDITNGDIYSGAETDTLTITSATANMNTYEYQCVVANSCGDITSNIAVLTIYQLVSITSQPVSQEIQEDSNAVFTVIANGDITAYQWRKNEITLLDTGNISGTTTNELTILNVSQNDAGNYDCVITGECNEVITNLASLTVLTSIETIQNSDDIKIYPNPTNGIFTIEGKDIQSIEITNINGQTVYVKNPQGFKNLAGLVQIDLSEQPKGIYFVKIWNNDFITVKKIVVE